MAAVPLRAAGGMGVTGVSGAVAPSRVEGRVSFRPCLPPQLLFGSRPRGRACAGSAVPSPSAVATTSARSYGSGSLAHLPS